MRRCFPILFFCSWLVSFYGRSQAPLEFIENKGQWNNWFQYKTSARGGDVCLEKDGLRYVLCDKDNNEKADEYHHGKTRIPPVLKFHEYKVTFEGCNVPVLESEKPQKVYYNYFIGNDSSRWKSGIHPCRAVNYRHLYDGVDMHITSEKGNVVYEFIAKPNADLSQVKLKFDGQDDIRIKNHIVVISTSVGEMQELKPYSFQYINDQRTEVRCEYHLRDNVLSFDFPDDYDHTKQLIIDPTVVFCTLSGSTADNWGYTATYDDAGNFYAGGLVNALAYAGGGAFPVSPGAFQTTFGGGVGTYPTIDSTYACDISIIKYDPTGVSRIYATYLGGSGNERPHSMIVDAGGNLIIAGRSRSTDYPTTAGAFQRTNHGGWDIVVTKLNPTGTNLVASTYIGGSGNDGVNFDSTEFGYGELKYNYGDDARSEVQVDKTGNIYVADCSNSTDFPVTTGTAISTTLSGMQDGVVFKFNSSLTAPLLWSTYLGGSGSDAAYVLAFDTSQSSIYVAGGTNSPNFPVTPGTLHTTFQGGRSDGFILKFNNSAPYNLLKGTYVGTSNYDQIYGIQVSGDNNVYVMGQSLGGSFPVTSGVYSNAGSCQFAMKLDNGLSSDLISTVFGSGDPTITNISPVAFLVDTCENVYISGWSGNLGLGEASAGLCFGMPTTPDAVQPTTLDGRDFYFIVLGPGMTALRYATFYGRNCSLAGEEWEGEHVDGGTSRFSKQGIIYQGICANCGGAPGVNPNSCANPFPTTTGVWSMVDASTNCNEAALKIAFNIGPVTADPIAGPSTKGCVPLTVNFTNLSVNGLTYLWNFGDGTPTTTVFSPTHIFTSPGVFTVTLSAANSNACFRVADTAYLTITVGSNSIAPGFTTALTDSCGPYIVSLANTSTDTFGTPSYQWWYGDGNTFTGAAPSPYSYADTGRYTIMLVMTDTAACKSPDTLTHQVDFSSQRVTASFSYPDSVCLGTPVAADLNMTNVNSTTWTYGDGTSSTATNAPHIFKSVGTYTVTLVALNVGGCGGGDTLTETIKILSVPTAAFTFSPTTPVANIPTTFTNQSENADRYLWNFGDSLTSTDANPIHQYNRTGNYKACLTAWNNSGCPSVACKQVATDVEPLIGLPSAFSPNGDGANEILYVRGAAIATLDLKIFNRWGQLVFETNSQQKGWDGTFNGQPQPMDAYAYVLNASFIDGTTRMMKGNITLLR